MLRLVLAIPVLLVTGACGGSGSGDVGGNAGLVLSRNEAGPDNEAAANVIVPAAAASPVQGAAELNGCRMETCSWSITRSRDLVRRTAAGSLYRLSLLGGASEHPDENYPEDSRGVRIAWNAAPHEVFVFCSRGLPAVILPTDGRLEVDVLDFVNGPVGALESSAGLYARVCHPGDDWASNGFAERFGYQARADEADIDIARPEDIFRFVR
ncbi:MAG TPA: hypothetical protein VK614_02605 [Allosphingosinicella sp.]|nr:hypothetical protein [Allosphingosinicella sp.]